jgi:uncharacterized protein involved in tellurium resistance
MIRIGKNMRILKNVPKKTREILIKTIVYVPMKNFDLIDNDMDLLQPTNQYQWMIDHRMGYPKIYFKKPWNVHGENHV